MHYELHIFSKPTGVTIRPVPEHQGMWRVFWADGFVSGMCNLARAKDAVRTHSHATTRGTWVVSGHHASGSALEAPPAAGSDEPIQDTYQPENASHAPTSLTQILRGRPQSRRKQS